MWLVFFDDINKHEVVKLMHNKSWKLKPVAALQWWPPEYSFVNISNTVKTSSTLWISRLLTSVTAKSAITGTLVAVEHPP